MAHYSCDFAADLMSVVEFATNSGPNRVSESSFEGAALSRLCPVKVVAIAEHTDPPGWRHARARCLQV